MRAGRYLDGVPGHLAQHRDRRDRARPGLGVVIAALCANGWVSYARVARGQVLGLRERDFVTAARRARRVEPTHHVPSPRAELARPGVRPDDVRFRRGDRDRGVAVVPGARPAGRLHVGRDARAGHSFLWKSGFAHYVLVPGLAIAWVMIAVNLVERRVARSARSAARKSSRAWFRAGSRTSCETVTWPCASACAGSPTSSTVELRAFAVDGVTWPVIVDARRRRARRDARRVSARGRRARGRRARDGAIVCPGHGYAFDLHTGRCAHDPGLELRRYPITLVGDEVCVDLL